MKNILVCVSGSISAYKVMDVLSGLSTFANVKVAVSNSSKKFLPMGALRAMYEVYDDEHIDNNSVIHVELAEWADVILYVPASANTIGKLANGLSNNLITDIGCVAIGALKPIIMYPAMNTNMYQNPFVVSNINKLEKAAIEFGDVREGVLACGAKGPGKLEKPRVIVEKIKSMII